MNKDFTIFTIFLKCFKFAAIHLNDFIENFRFFSILETTCMTYFFLKTVFDIENWNHFIQI